MCIYEYLIFNNQRISLGLLWVLYIETAATLNQIPKCIYVL